MTVGEKGYQYMQFIGLKVQMTKYHSHSTNIASGFRLSQFMRNVDHTNSDHEQHIKSMQLAKYSTSIQCNNVRCSIKVFH